METTVRVLALLILLTQLNTCSSSQCYPWPTTTPKPTTTATTPPPIAGTCSAGTKDDSQLLEFYKSVEQTAYDLHNRLRAEFPGTNLALSITSLVNLLGMLLMGAKGNTAIEIKKIQLFDRIHPELIGTVFLWYNKEFEKVQGVPGEKTQVIVFHDKSVAISQPYQKMLMECFHTLDVAEKDFRKKPELDSHYHILHYLFDLFKIRIWLPSTKTSVVFSSISRFEGEWVTNLRNKTIHVGQLPFEKLNGEKVDGNFIMGTDDMFYYEKNEKLALLGVEYEGEKELFLAFLPKDPKEFNRITADDIKKLTDYDNFNQSRKQMVRIIFPRFSIGANPITLKKTLKEIGIKSVFSKEEADLSKIPEDPRNKIFLDEIYQNALTTISEVKTLNIARVSTDIQRSDKQHSSFKTGVPQEEIPVFEATHPFIYMIVRRVEEYKQLVPILIGSVADPTECLLPKSVQPDQLRKLFSNVFQLTFGLHHLLHHEERNTAFSVPALTNILTLMFLGSYGETRKEIRNVPIFEGLREIATMELLYAFQLSIEPDKKRLSYRNGIIVDKVWTQKLKPYFSSIAEYCLMAHVAEVDFGNFNFTDANLNPIFGPFQRGAPFPNDSSALVLTSSVTFNGQWDAELTEQTATVFKSDFTLSNGNTKKTDFIQMESDKFYYNDEHPNCTVVGVDYKTDETTSKYFFAAILPKDVELLQSCTLACKDLLITDNFAPNQQKSVKIFLPKFKIGYDHNGSSDVGHYDLTNLLKSLGVKKPFEATNETDFTPIAESDDGKKIYVAHVYHVANIIFNDTDTLGFGGAVVPLAVPPSGAEVVEHSKREEPEHQFKADRPFIFHIVRRFESLKQLLPVISGTVMNPSDG